MSDVVIFAKAPVLGKVKTRLAQDIGEAAALSIYRRMLYGVTARLTTGDWRLRLAVTPDDSLGEDDLWPRGVARLAQGDGDLGARMLRLLEIATPDAPVVVVGSDIPELASEHVARAFAALKAKPMVFGPAEDGGFYLVGAHRPPPAGLFHGVTWSNETVLRDSIRGCGKDNVKLIDTLADLDDVASLRAHGMFDE